VKLQKHKAYQRDGVDYHKFVVVIPPEHVDALGWDSGQELEAVVRKDGLLLRPAEPDD
jgi:bifunctional DNA-binding transcriptional regulator/antitoxin component of YhaV-PrlF toxin-antitoxin module